MNKKARMKASPTIRGITEALGINPDSVQLCEVCYSEIKVMAFKNTGVCCELHEKVRDGLITRSEADGRAARSIRSSIT